MRTHPWWRLVSASWLINLSTCSLLPREPDSDDILEKFVTRPDIVAPKWDINLHEASAVAPGYWFVAPYAYLDQISYSKWNGPLIYDGQGQLIWSGAPMFNRKNAFDFRTVEVEGRQMASLMTQYDEAGFIFDDTYTLYKTLNMTEEKPQWILDNSKKHPRTNMHEFNIMSNGSRALIMNMIYDNATTEESEVVGFAGNCSAQWQAFKEIDLSNGRPIFEWNPHGHIGLDECTLFPDQALQQCIPKENSWKGWDILHLNSVDKFPDGDYLLSSRNTDAVYKISHTDGSIIWRLGGVKSDFEMGDAARFTRQHHARVLSQNETHTTLSLFDNAAGHLVGNDLDGYEASNDHSRGLILSLSTKTSPMTAEVLQQFEHPDKLMVAGRGSMQVLSGHNNNTFVGWVEKSRISEHGSDGRLLMDAALRVSTTFTYRAYKFPWIGRPTAPPDVYSTTAGAGKPQVVHVSWNGATEVAKWALLRTDRNGDSQGVIAASKRHGVETAITFDGYAKYVVACALDAHGMIIGRSDVCTTATPPGPPPAPLATFSLGLICGVALTAAIGVIRHRRRAKSLFRWRSENEKYAYSPLKDSDDTV